MLEGIVRIFKDQVFESETFKGEQLVSVDARNARFVDCVFEGCSLSSVKLDNALLSVAFKNCKIEGINFFTARKMMMSLRFESCLIRHSSFAGLKLKEISFAGSTLNNVDFADAELIEADFSNCAFEDTVFQHSNLTKAEFRGAHGYAIDPTLNKIRGAIFDVPEVLALLSPFGIVIE